MARLLLLTLIGLLTWAASSDAQSVRVLVLDPTTYVPTAAGYVVLLDTTDQEVTRAVNSQDGLLAFSAPAPGRYRLASVRVGYQTTFSEPFSIDAAQAVDLMLDLAHERVDLQDLVSSDQNACVTAAEDAEGVGLLWQEIAKALAATLWLGEDGHDYYSLLYERDVDSGGRRVLAEQTSVGQGLMYQGGTYDWQEPFIASHADSGMAYNPPNPAMLLSDRFTSDYCFNLQRYEDVVQLAFEPKRTGDDPDIAGAFSVDRATARLQSFEYRFLNVPIEVGGDQAGGRIAFMPGPSGRWLSNEWEMQTPLFAIDENERPVFAGTHHMGGQIAAITRGEDVVYSADLTEFTGVVLDSPRGAGLAGAEVILVGTSYRATTDESGRFRIAGPLDGEYAVTFTHRTLDSLGLVAPDTVVTLEGGQASTLSLHPIGQAEYIAAFLGVRDVFDKRTYRGNRPTRTRNVITREHLAAYMDNSILEIVRRLRPDWFRSRGTASFDGTPTDPVAFRNGKYVGPASVLASIIPDNVDEVWYFTRAEATQRWGSRFGRPVIEVIDRGRR